jgi:hypothetical protein
MITGTNHSFLGGAVSSAATQNRMRYIIANKNHFFIQFIIKERRCSVPKENEARPCVHPGCRGTQTYKSSATPPGSQSGVSAEGGPFIPGAVRSVPAWVCDINKKHFEPVESN